MEVLAIVQEFDSFALNMLILLYRSYQMLVYLFILYAHDLGPTTCLSDCRSTTFFLAVLFLAVGLTTPGAVDDLATIVGSGSIYK